MPAAFLRKKGYAPFKIPNQQLYITLPSYSCLKAVIPELNISSVITTSVCPVRFFLLQKTRASESPRYTVAKQISYHLGTDMDKEEIWDEISLIQKENSHENRDFFEECIRICRHNPGWRNYCDSDVKVHSSKYHLHGIVDKIFDDAPVFSIIRPSQAPPSGIYSSDRLRIAAYTACLQEMLGSDIEGGSVEYIPSGITRFCRVEPLDKRRFLRALYETRRIRNGEMPRRPLRPPCEKCPEKGRCTPGEGIRLSDLF
jgi:CRISPR-associated exonuclease Cas4